MAQAFTCFTCNAELTLLLSQNFCTCGVKVRCACGNFRENADQPVCTTCGQPFALPPLSDEAKQTLAASALWLAGPGGVERRLTVSPAFLIEIAADVIDSTQLKAMSRGNVITATQAVAIARFVARNVKIGVDAAEQIRCMCDGPHLSDQRPKRAANAALRFFRDRILKRTGHAAPSVTSPAHREALSQARRFSKRALRQFTLGRFCILDSMISMSRQWTPDSIAQVAAQPTLDVDPRFALVDAQTPDAEARSRRKSRLRLINNAGKVMGRLVRLKRKVPMDFANNLERDCDLVNSDVEYDGAILGSDDEDEAGNNAAAGVIQDADGQH